MKHAYLIMAHNEWELLQALIERLDDERNDIFVHIDAKVGTLPELAVSHAGLTVLDRRTDVRWGDLSVVEAEFALFEAAVSAGPYAYYHLLSGVDLPLKSQNFIHAFFEANQGREFIGYTLTSMTPELERRACRWHLFPKSFHSRNLLIRIPRAVCLRVQELFGIRRNGGVDLKKGSQWVSVTDAMARLFIAGEDWALKTFSHTFCPDEMVMQTLCWQSPLRENIWCTDDDGRGCMRAIGWRDGCLYDWTACDYDVLAASPALFARKFNSRDRDFIDRIIDLSR